MNVSGLAVSRNNTQPLLALHLFDCCLLSVKKYRLGTSKCHDHDIFTIQQPIRLQHFERGNENTSSTMKITTGANIQNNGFIYSNITYFQWL